MAKCAQTKRCRLKAFTRIFDEIVPPLIVGVEGASTLVLMGGFGKQFTHDVRVIGP